ncbi:hypothetical protein CONLIGDRAFT_135389 [Coniochaeta ligniaria NRRL 30616]|uniref:Uncharacterized protein n=1 Tax=Coniochaeta ligniaria NRRL 30616 TaxID=1408157 RepID=A0A1J7J344_9PEZI|nr:hypothetical protein CONLIGDRAFT_135389 [Coniochaeta ligniaria NRRL 30616]
MPRYVVTEPHPTVVQNTYIHAGRGGAGNLFRAPQTTPATGVPTEIKPAKAASSGRFYSGRGGAGNVHSAVQRPVLSLDEEYAITEAREKTSPFAHVGRGGAGNFVGGGVYPAEKAEKKDRKMSVASDVSRRDSTSSSGSARSTFLQRLGSHITRHNS